MVKKGPYIKLRVKKKGEGCEEEEVDEEVIDVLMKLGTLNTIPINRSGKSSTTPKIGSQRKIRTRF